jgi:acylphosphatase
MDHDGVMDRKYDLLLNDKTDYDEKVADVVCHCINFVSNVRDVAVEAVYATTDPNRKKDLLAKLESISKTKAKSSHRSGESRIYEDLIKGIFDINVTRIVRTSKYRP